MITFMQALWVSRCHVVRCSNACLSPGHSRFSVCVLGQKRLFSDNFKRNEAVLKSAKGFNGPLSIFWPCRTPFLCFV